MNEGKFNLLDEWKAEMEKLTSPLYTGTYNSIDRDSVYFIYNLFKEFFGSEYFDVKTLANTEYYKTFLNKNYFYQLLYSPGNHAVNLTLLDTATLFNYSQRLDKRIYKHLQSLKNKSNDLRNYLFEIYIIRMLKENGIFINVKPIVGRQELEAIATLNGEECLIECKKLYNTEFSRFQHLNYLFEYFFDKWCRKFQVGIYIIISAPNQDLRALSEEKELIRRWVAEYEEEIKQKQSIDFEFIKKNKNGQIILQIGKSVPGLLENLVRLNPYPCVYLNISPPPIFIINHKNFFHFHQGYHFFIPQKDIEKKILETIKKKRRQHRLSTINLRVFFFENEFTASAEVPLLTEKILNSSLITTYIYSKNSLDILCIVDKKMNPSEALSNTMYVYCKPNLHEIGTTLKNLKSKAFVH